MRQFKYLYHSHNECSNLTQSKTGNKILQKVVYTNLLFCTHKIFIFQGLIYKIKIRKIFIPWSNPRQTIKFFKESPILFQSLSLNYSTIIYRVNYPLLFILCFFFYNILLKFLYIWKKNL